VKGCRSGGGDRGGGREYSGGKGTGGASFRRSVGAGGRVLVRWGWYQVWGD